MNRYYYQCTFLTDIISKESSATIGHSKTLDYIGGSNFLGIVAKHYGAFSKETAYRIFHSGNIHFGDAHLAIHGNRSIKKPAVWFHEKMDTDQNKIYLHHKINDNMRKDFANNSIQLKQIRQGFFIIDDDKIKSKSADHTYAIKSAHDINKRRSKDEVIFGYDALNKGTEWIFYIDANEADISLIEDCLLGEKSIGKSKSSQYGRILIDKLDHSPKNIPIEKNVTDYKGERILLIYFDAQAAFLDPLQQPTFQPDIHHLLLDDTASINWELSQIRTKVYSPWNHKRKTRDFDRTCIDKGSVIAVNISHDFDIEKYNQRIKSGVGLFKNEGFGQVLINPSFLTKNKNTAILDYEMDRNEDNTSNSIHIQWIVPNGDNDQQILDRIGHLRKEKQDYNRRIG